MTGLKKQRNSIDFFAFLFLTPPPLAWIVEYDFQCANDVLGMLDTHPESQEQADPGGGSITASADRQVDQAPSDEARH